jgi:hypothetical protein
MVVEVFRASDFATLYVRHDTTNGPRGKCPWLRVNGKKRKVVDYEVWYCRGEQVVSVYVE